MDKVSQDMAVDREAKLAAIAGELIFEILNELDKSVDNRMFSDINNSTASDKASWSAWGEKHAYDRLRKRLNQKVKLGVGARIRLKPVMEQA